MNYRYRDLRNLTFNSIYNRNLFPPFHFELGIPNLKEPPLIHYNDKDKKLKVLLFFKEGRLSGYSFKKSKTVILYRRLNYQLSDIIKRKGNEPALLTDTIKERHQIKIGNKLVYTDNYFIRYYTPNNLNYEVTLYLEIDLKDYVFNEKEISTFRPKFTEFLYNKSLCLIDCNCMDYHFSGKRYIASISNLGYYKTFIKPKKLIPSNKGVLCKHMVHSFTGLFKTGEKALVTFLLKNTFPDTI